MDEELFQLCKEVYKRFPDWVDTDRIYGKEAGKDWYITNFRYAFPKRQRIPLYTSDYLLEKLPQGIKGMYLNIFNAGLTSWYALYGRTTTAKETGLYGEADTPLKALLKLTIALHEAGELK